MNHRMTIITMAGAIAFALGSLGQAANAASGGGGSGSSGGSSSGQTVACNEGWVYDKEKQVCIRKDAAIDRELYETGRDLALDGRYDEAIATLSTIRDQEDPMVLTMIGYSKRKLGLVDEGIAFYHRALAIDPDNVNTREYLGEGYVALGRTDLAQVQLDRIEAVCGSTCPQFQKLAAVITDAGAWTAN